ncbi:hypothetical protein RintRC_6883 [Richelia intracellularis]|nr:hypothetical protein RintRC_6883 [Richelia intracellularis]
MFDVLSLAVSHWNVALNFKAFTNDYRLMTLVLRAIVNS